MGALIGHLLGHPEPPAIPFIELHNAGLEKGKRYCIEFMYKPAGEKEIIEKFTASVIEIEYNGKVQFFLGERNAVTSYRRLFTHSKIRALEI